jgi:GNAT superfamily N-acetyltransferase
VNTTATINPAQPEHAEALAALLDEVERFYGATQTEPNGQTIRHVQEALFSNPPAAYALLAWDKKQLIGFASYSYLWPAAGSTRSLYLKELYVTEDHRAGGVGRLLMDELCRIAVEHDCSRVEWTTDHDNPGAQKFYQTLGYTPNPSKIFYPLEGDRLLATSSRGRQPLVTRSCNRLGFASLYQDLPIDGARKDGPGQRA